MTATTRDGNGGSITYAAYLQLDALLALQRGQTAPPHPDELLFIVVHQTSELWFKVILHELDGLVASLEAREEGSALWRIGRINALMRIVSAQLSALESLPPQRFAEFRAHLGTSSGSQSIQFRAIEAAAGLRDPAFMHALHERGEIPALIGAILTRPTLQTLFLRVVEGAETTLEALYSGPGPSTLFFLAEALLEFEQQFAQWRFKHVQLVERIIGPQAQGTGGTLGARYLAQAVAQRFFPALWSVRVRFFGGSGAG
ncbi:MAG: tryptophan 2,3-dioxygenase family protein [Gemmatimonadaceae bacterium]